MGICRNSVDFTLRTVMIVAFITSGLREAWSQNDERYYEQGGITFKETRTKVQQPVRELEYKDEPQTFYRERYITDMQPTPQTVYQPVTQYYWEPRWHGWWRPFQGPNLAYHLVPRSTWQPQVVNYQVPVTRREVIPETRTVRVAVPKLTMKEVDQVTRVAVGPAAPHNNLAQATPTPTAPLAWNLTGPPVATPMQPLYLPPQQPYAYPPYAYGGTSGLYGGVARLEGDPPRYGVITQPGREQGAWQARRDTDAPAR